MKSYIYNNKDNLIDFINNNLNKNNHYEIIILFPENKINIKDEIVNFLNDITNKFSINTQNIGIENQDIILIYKEQNILKYDIKHLKKMALLGDMIANISHQWRQPLSVITSSASAMILHKDLNILDDKSFEKFANNIISQGQFLAQTIDTFRSYIKKDNTVIKTILQEEIKLTLKILESVLSQNYIKVTNNTLKKENTNIHIIKGEFSQVLINIITNAKDVFISNNIKNKEIIIDLKQENNKCVVCIEDNAGGINEDIIDKIFQEDFTTKDNDGTGIGLSMSYDIVTEHLNGNLYVKNTKKGAKFFIELPL